MKVKELIKALKRANGNDNVLLTIARPDERGIKHGYLTKVTDVLSLMGDTIIKGELDIIDPIESTESVVKRIMGRELTDTIEEKVLPGCEELTPEEKMNHPLYLEGFDMGREVQKVFDEQNKATLADIAEKYAEKLDISKGWFDGCEIDELIKESYIAGAEWGAEHAKIESEKPVQNNLEEAADDHIRKVVDAAGHPGWDWETQDIAEAFKAGAEWQKAKMMKDAVEGEVIKTNKHTSVRYKSYYGTDRYFYGIADKQFKAGDKVRIIIIPKEDGE